MDGFPTLFYQKYWHILGTKVTVFYLSVLRGGTAMDSINQTHIVLIPKVSKPESITQFRPINLSTVLYKIIAKVIVIPMRDCLDVCFHESQCTFVLG